MTRRAALLAALILAALLLAMPEAHGAYHGTDVWGNIGGAADAQLSPHPLSAYSLDYFIDVGITDPPSWFAAVVAGVTTAIYTAVTWIYALLCGLLAWAFSLDLINGPRGALQPISDATRALYGSLMVQSVLAVGIVAAGAWGTWQLMRHRTERMAGGLLLSLVCMVLGLLVVFNAQDTVGRMSQWSNGLKLAGLSAAIRGTVRDPDEVKQEITRYVFNYGVLRTWTVMEFGGLRHCVDTDNLDQNGFPAPVSQSDPKRDVCRDHLKQDSSGHGGYAERFLSQPSGSDARRLEYEALRDGKVPAAGTPVTVQPNPRIGGPQPGAIQRGPTQAVIQHQFTGYLVDKADAPAVDMMQQAMVYQRLLLVLLVLLGAVRMAMLFGALALGVVLAQVAVLVLLSLAPLALLAGVIPGRGQAGFLKWGEWLLGSMFIGVVYAALVAVVLIVSTALADATDTMGFLWSYGLQTAYFWVIFKKRHDLADAVLRGRQDNIKRHSVRRAVYTARHPVAAVTYGAVRPRYGSRGGSTGGGQRSGYVTDMREQYHQSRRPEEGDPGRIPTHDPREGEFSHQPSRVAAPQQQEPREPVRAE